MTPFVQRPMIPTSRIGIAFILCAAVAACGAPSSTTQQPSTNDALRVPAERLPTGVSLDPVGTFHDVGSLPLQMLASPDSRYFVLVNSGYQEQGAQIIERSTGNVLQ